VSLFREADAVEFFMGKSCEDMTVDQLVAYIKRQQEDRGRKLAVTGQNERSMIRRLKREYGEKTAGQIIKWVFHKYKGVYGREIVTYTAFAKGRQWWTDKMHQELQAALRVEDSRLSGRSGHSAEDGFATAGGDV